MSVLAVGFPDGESDRIVCDAGSYAASTDQSLIVAHIVPESSFARRQQSYAAFDTWDGEYSLTQAQDRAALIARTVATEALRGMSVAYRCVGRIGSLQREIQRLAREYDCEHLFMPRLRRPWYRRFSSDPLDVLSRSFSGPITTRPVSSSSLPE
ncbi:universal stress protein [Halocatena marina]|nr:universal stress protein [Halocatena marina]